MSRKKIFLDPSFWILIVINGYLVYRYYQQPDIFMTLVWLYWSQSILLGIFTVLDLLTIKRSIPVRYKVDNTLKVIPQDGKARRAAAKTFIIGYGILHFIYLLFLLTMKRDAAPIQWDFFKYFFYAFLAGQVINFLQHKIQQRKYAADTGPIMSTPFIRVLPMHLTIILASFFPAGGIGIFLVLKLLADAGMYVATKPTYRSRETDTAMLASQQGMNVNM